MERRERRRERGKFILNIHYNETYVTEPRTMVAVREKIFYRALISYTWFWF